MVGAVYAVAVGGNTLCFLAGLTTHGLAFTSRRAVTRHGLQQTQHAFAAWVAASKTAQTKCCSSNGMYHCLHAHERMPELRRTHLSPAHKLTLMPSRWDEPRCFLTHMTVNQHAEEPRGCLITDACAAINAHNAHTGCKQSLMYTQSGPVPQTLPVPDTHRSLEHTRESSGQQHTHSCKLAYLQPATDRAAVENTRAHLQVPCPHTPTRTRPLLPVTQTAKQS